jgi:Gnt-I system low-affinity gluconate transporter
MQFLGHPFTALMVTLLGCMMFFGWRRGLRRDQLLKLATASLAPIASLLLIMGAGGAFKQIIVDTGAGALFRLCSSHIWSRPGCVRRKARPPSQSSPPPES